MTFPKLPENFDPFLPIINYYRNELNIDCLLSLQEQFLCYMCYHFVNPGRDKPNNERDARYSTRYNNFSFNCYFYETWCRELNKVIIFDDVEQDRLELLALIKPNEIDLYIKHVYLKYYKLNKLNDNKKYINIDCNGVVMKLNHYMLLRYSKFYRNTYDEYKYNEIKINIHIDKVTAQCIEGLINDEDMYAILNAKNLVAYHAMIDYLDINLLKLNK